LDVSLAAKLVVVNGGHGRGESRTFGFMGLVVIGRTRETSSGLVGLGLNVQHATGCRIMEL
jgi:hypothetical protein